MKLNCMILAACLHALPFSLEAQNNVYPISSNHIDLLRFKKDIPALNSAKDIIQGPQGHIWISGKGGLIRYNGSSFKAFNLKNTPSLKGEKFEFLATDGKNQIFVSSPSGIHSVSNGIIQRLTPMDSLNQIRSIAVDKNGILWIINDKKLFRYKDGELSSQQLTEKQILQVIELNDGTVWALGKHNFYKLAPNGFVSYKTKHPIIDVFVGGGIDTKGSPFFISNFQAPLVLNQDQFETASWASIFHGKLLKNAIQDKKGILWYSGRGISNTDFIDTNSYNFSKVNFDNQTFNICIDKDNTKWIIGEQGIWIIRDTNTKSIYLEGIGEKIFSMATSGMVSLGDSVVLVGTNGEGIRYLKNNKLRYSDTRRATGEVIYGLQKEKEHYISYSNWGTFRFKFDGQNIFTLDTLMRDVTFLYFKEKEGTEFFSILRNNNERSVVYKRKGQFYTIPELNEHMIFEIVETSGYGLVFCTSKGVYSYNKGRLNSLMERFDIPVDECLTAWEDPDSETLFIGTIGSGLIRILKENVDVFTTQNGFPTNTVSNLLSYRDKLLVTGRNELYQFDIKSLLNRKNDTLGLGKYSIYDLKYEVKSVGGPNIVLIGDNKVLVNTNAGISEIDLNSQKESFFNLQIESVQTNDSTFIAPSSVYLKARDKEISINFSAIRFIDKKFTPVSYKLEGFEETWKTAGGQNAANYPNLPSGSFVFRLREQNSDGTVFYADPVTIHKDIPWFLSGPVIVVYVVAGLFLIGRIIAYRTRMIRRQNEKLQAEVDRQTIALQKSIERTEETVIQRTKELRKAYELLQEGEERLSRAFEISKDGIWDWNLKSDKLTISNAVYNMLGFEAFEFPASFSEIFNRIHPSDCNLEELNYFDDPANAPENGFDAEFRLAHKNGKYIWVRIKAKTYGHDRGGVPKRMVGVIMDISDEKEQKQQILEAVVKTENLERSRISKDIHDGLQQTLTISQMNLVQLKKFMKGLPKSALEKYEICKNHLTKSIEESRNVAHTLMPRSISDLGLVRSVEDMVESMNQSNPTMNFVLSQNIENEVIKSKEVIITLYRVLQEALNNVVKYSRATQVNIQLMKHTDILTMTVEDNGVGFDKKAIDKNSFGINSMSNRLDAIDGFLEIDSIQGKGTYVMAEVNNVFEVD